MEQPIYIKAPIDIKFRAPTKRSPVFGAVYITESKLNQLIRDYDGNNKNNGMGSKNKYIEKLHFLSTYEKANLQKYQNILEYLSEDDINFLDLFHKIDKSKDDTSKIKPTNTTPKYHLSLDCKYIHADYSNIEIPEILRNDIFKKDARNFLEKHPYMKNGDYEAYQAELFEMFGEENVTSVLEDSTIKISDGFIELIYRHIFRNWIKPYFKIIEIYVQTGQETDPWIQFCKFFKEKWGIETEKKHWKHETHNNSGYTEFHENYLLEDLEKNIDHNLSLRANMVSNLVDKNIKMIYNKQQKAHYKFRIIRDQYKKDDWKQVWIEQLKKDIKEGNSAYKSKTEDIYKKIINISDDQVIKIIDFMSSYSELVANIINQIKAHIRVSINPDLKFEGGLLDQLGFEVCHYCVSEFHHN